MSAPIPGFNTSNSYAWRPPIAELVLEAYSKIQMRGPQVGAEQIIEARRSANLILQDFSNRGVNQWSVGDPDIFIPLTPGVGEYVLPANTVNLLDCYIRQYSPNSGVATSLGNALVPIFAQGGDVLVAQPYGDVLVAQPGSATLSCVAGSNEILLRWPSHGLSVGSPIFWNCPVSIGALVLDNFSIVDAVIDQDTVQFQAAVPALETQQNQGATTLFTTTAGSGTVFGFLPNHGLTVGATYSPAITTTVDGITLTAGTDYTIASVPNSYSFTFAAGAFAGSTDAQFMNSGQLSVTEQTPGTLPQDVIVMPLSRTDYAGIPVKGDQGRPTTYFFKRTLVPTISLWEVPPAGTSEFYAFVAYRMREVQDANPMNGQTLDTPRRFYMAFVAELTAALAEKYKPELWEGKLQYAAGLWDRAASEDREKVSTWLAGEMQAFFN